MLNNSTIQWTESTLPLVSRRDKGENKYQFIRPRPSFKKKGKILLSNCQRLLKLKGPNFIEQKKMLDQ